MSNFAVFNPATTTSTISDNAYRIHDFLLGMCYGSKNTCFPSQQYIAKKTHGSVRTVQRGLKDRF